MLLKINTKESLDIAMSVTDADIVIPFKVAICWNTQDDSDLCIAVEVVMRVLSRWKSKDYVSADDFCEFMYAELVIFGKTPKSDLILEKVAISHSVKFVESLRMQVGKMACGEI